MRLVTLNFLANQIAIAPKDANVGITLKNGDGFRVSARDFSTCNYELTEDELFKNVVSAGFYLVRLKLPTALVFVENDEISHVSFINRKEDGNV